MTHVALYGGVGIERTFCKECECTAFVIKGIKQCCDTKTDEAITGKKRMFESDDTRCLPTRKEQKEILAAQHGRCLYCDRRFDALVWYHGKYVRLRRHWDHMVPFSYTRDNRAVNFVAACHVCNLWKSNLIFNTLEEVQVYVGVKWERAEIDVGKHLPGMRDQIPE